MEGDRTFRSSLTVQDTPRSHRREVCVEDALVNRACDLALRTSDRLGAHCRLRALARACAEDKASRGDRVSIHSLPDRMRRFSRTPRRVLRIGRLVELRCLAERQDLFSRIAASPCGRSVANRRLSTDRFARRRPIHLLADGFALTFVIFLQRSSCALINAENQSSVTALGRRSVRWRRQRCDRVGRHGWCPRDLGRLLRQRCRRLVASDRTNSITRPAIPFREPVMPCCTKARPRRAPIMV